MVEENTTQVPTQTTDAAPPEQQKEPSKKNKPSLWRYLKVMGKKKYKDAKRVISKDTRIQYGLEKLQDLKTYAKDKAIQTTKFAFFKTIETSTLIFFKFPLVIALILFLTSPIGISPIPKLYETLTNLLTPIKFLTPIIAGWIAMLTTIALLILALTFILTLGSSDETKKKSLNKILSIWFSIIVILLTVNLLFPKTLQAGDTSAIWQETTQTGTEKTTSALIKSWENIKCLFSPTCIAQKQQTTKTQVSAKASYAINYLTPPTLTKTLIDWKQTSTTINYNTKSTGGLTLEKIECYANKKTTSNLFHQETLNKNLDDNGIGTPLNIKCDYTNLNLEEPTKQEEITIIPVLYFNIETTFNIDFPIISQQKYYELTGKTTEKDGNLEYPSAQAITYTGQQKKEPVITLSNNALQLTTAPVKSTFPLIFGNEKIDIIEIPLEIKKSQTNPFGKILSTQIKDLNLPTFLKLQQANIDFEKTKEDTLYLSPVLIEQETPENLELIDLPIITSTIKMITTSQVEHDLNKYKIIIKPQTTAPTSPIVS